MPLLKENRPLLPVRIANWILLLICGLILCAIFIAGLSPFTSHPRNEVKWLQNQSGLYFGEYASILSSAPLRWDEPPDGPCSIEFWMQPGLIEDSNTMLAFDSREAPIRFRIRQSLDDLALERKSTSHNGPKARVLYVPHALRQDTPLFITLTSGTSGISIYLNGVLVRSSSDFSFARRDLSGQMVVGNSPFADDSWSGVLRGIGLYDRELTAEEVKQNYADWTVSGQPSALAEKQATAVFRFNERSGTVVHNQVPGGIDLYIPDHYLVLHPPFLEAFWRPTDWGWGFWKDALVNVGGFVPLGFFFCVYFSRSMPVTRAILLTIAFGCAVSFFIEATQFYLPTRDSDSRDWLNNTLGTILGAFMYGPGFVQRILARLGVAAIDRPNTGNPLRPDVVTSP
jgi:VanZ like family/Concanavalin A-like lectin/glucanases superfamily